MGQLGCVERPLLIRNDRIANFTVGAYGKQVQTIVPDRKLNLGQRYRHIEQLMRSANSEFRVGGTRREIQYCAIKESSRLVGSIMATELSTRISKMDLFLLIA
jgi:hypothetical protein